MGFNSGTPLRHLLCNLNRPEGQISISNVVVINNSLGDAGEINDIAKTYGCDLVQCDENLGYGAGCNIGASHATGELILFLNPDVYISRASISLMLRASLVMQGGVAFGPAIYDEGRRRRIKKTSIADPARLQKSRLPSEIGVTPTAYISGCALLVRREAFLQVGGFDEKIFLYYEDDDICIRLRALGALYVVDAAVALHSHGRSASEPPKWRKLRAQNLGYSMLYVMRKHRGANGTASAMLRTALRCISPLNLMSLRYRTKTIHMTVGSLRALRTLGRDEKRIWKETA